MAKYKLTDSDIIHDTETGAFIPSDSANRHYQEYLEWVGEGNTPDPAYTGAELKENKTASLNQTREQKLNEGLEFDGNSYDSDQRSRENLSGTVAFIASGNSLPPGFTWRTSDNQNIAMDETKVVQFGAAMIAFVNDIYGISWTLKSQVDALDENAPDLQDQLDAIQWPGSP